jgi:uncharacterized protein (TIGR00369 family)
MEQKEYLLKNIESYLDDAGEEEIEVLSTLLKAIKDKQAGHYRSFISAFMQVNSKVLDNGDFKVTIPISKLISNPLNFVHGGITATLLDTAMGSFVNQSLPEHLAAVTSELKINYLKPGFGKELTCIASIVHKGSSVYVCEAKVYDDKQSIMAMGSGSFFIIKRPLLSQ